MDTKKNSKPTMTTAQIRNAYARLRKAVLAGRVREVEQLTNADRYMADRDMAEAWRVNWAEAYAAVRWIARTRDQWYDERSGREWPAAKEAA